MTELSKVDREAVLLQTDRLLSSSHFRTSRRYPALLRYVVQRTLDGHAEILKERNLGIEIFGREPSFDTSGDSIVRVAAAEVRKRIAQYYQEEGHEHELRIDLPSGSYVPRFRDPVGPAPPIVSALETSAPSQSDQTVERVTTSATASRRLKFAIAAMTLTLAAIAALVGFRYLGLSGEQKDLLGPLWKSPQPAIICVGSPLLAQNQPGAEDPSIAMALGQPTANNTLLPFADAITISRFQILLNTRHKSNRVQLARNTTFNDLRAGPTILIGALDNPWTIRLTDKLRFRFIGTDESEAGIVDSKASPDRRWTVDFHVPYSNRTQDYAIVAITHDETLDQPLLIAAGIGPNGTMAASEFLLSQDDLAALVQMAPAKWSGKNVEAVLATQVIQGNSGPPRIVAAEFW